MTREIKKTALVLGGGGARGAYEAGVWKALRELDVNIDTVVGTSIGALNAVMVAQDAYEDTVKLWLEIKLSDLFDIDKKKADDFEMEIANLPAGQVLEAAKKFFTNDASGGENIIKLLEQYAPLDKITNPKIPFGFVMAEWPLMAGKWVFYDQVPKEELHKHILASCATFPFSRPVEIGDKKYVDGGFADNMPINMVLGKGFDRIIAVNLHAYGKIHEEDQKKAQDESEYILISNNIALGSILDFGRENSLKKIELGYLDTMKRFGVYDGKDYTFKKGALPEEELDILNKLAMTFHLDPLVIYDRETFLKALRKEILSAQLKIRKFKKPIKGLADMADMAVVVTFIAQCMRDKENDHKIIDAVTATMLKDSRSQAEYLVKNDLLLD